MKLDEKDRILSNTWHLFCDESGISGKPFYAFGALWIKENNLSLFEREITELRQKHCCGDEIKWQAAKSKRYAEFYRDLIHFFFKSNYLFFNCIVVELAVVNKKFNIWSFYDPTKGARKVKTRETRLKYPLLEK
ncbi:DUF3800 domain-containing protein [Gallibacterium anatis]|uniref:DUF3800 domain-containing protein n=1 Tax=Gallibacterium anatis TaxID=750 RepID=UPI0005314AEC|nr:DUF3800 domain-containing protein [Gallibacterium anatis]KGQ66579.1 hypothetical protein IO49_04490 [Gallibacterium anatis]